MHLKKVILEKHAKLGLFLSKSQFSMFLGNNFFKVHFVTEESLHFWNLRKILRLLIPILSRYLQKNFQPYIVYCTQWPRPTLKWLLEKTNFLSFSLLFLRFTTNLRGTLALVSISTHPTVQCQWAVLQLIVAFELSCILHHTPPSLLPVTDHFLFNKTIPPRLAVPLNITSDWMRAQKCWRIRSILMLIPPTWKKSNPYLA
jgi:hypothetical protein